MLILWRMLLLALLSLAVLVCYPYYQAYGIVTVFFVFMAAVAAMILLTWISSLLYLSRSKLFNFLFDVVMCAAMILLLLIFIPQEGARRPLEKLQKGIYPTERDIRYGLSKLGLGEQSDALKKEIKDTAEEFRDGVNQIEKIIHKG